MATIQADGEIESTAVPAATQTAGTDPLDPFEPVNRAVFLFNDAVDGYLVEPLVEGWRFVLPEFVREGIYNVVRNLTEPVSLVNGALQGKPDVAALALVRFMFNSVFGVAGFVDVAGMAGHPRQPEDFGQTFAVWGMGEGPFLMAPLIGPLTTRDTIGLVPDAYLWPVHYADANVRYKADAISLFVARDHHQENIELLREAAPADRYVFIREAWRARRRNEVHDGNPPPPPPDPALFED